MRWSTITRFAHSLTPGYLGPGAGIALWVLLGLAVGSLFALEWAAVHIADYGRLYAEFIGLIIIGFLAISGYAAAVRGKTGLSLGKRMYVWGKSIPLAVALLTSLAYASVAGSVYSAVEPAYGKAYIFHSWWYVALLVSLAVNLILCSWQSSWVVLQLPGRVDLRTSESFFKQARHQAQITIEGTPGDALSAFRRVYPKAHGSDDGAAYAQRGVFKRFGPTVVHIGLLLAMAAGGYRILSERIGLREINAAAPGQPIPSSEIAGMGLFDSQIQIEEGVTTSTIMVKKDRMTPFSGANSRDVTLDFTVKCHNFEADMYPGTETPRYFGSLLEITAPNGEKKIATVDMNTAVEFRGYKFSQNSYQARPWIPREMLNVIESATGTIHRVDVGPNTRNKLSNKGALERYQLEVDEPIPGGTWTLWDMQAEPPKQLAQNVILPPYGGWTFEPLVFYRDFDFTSDGPTEASAQMRKPMLTVRSMNGNTGEETYSFVATQGNTSINEPDDFTMTLANIRPVKAGATNVNTAGQPQPTGDVPTTEQRAASGATTRTIDGGDDPKVQRMIDEQLSVTTDYDYRVVIFSKVTGRLLMDRWVAAGEKVRVTEASGAELQADPAVEEARKTGQRFVVRYEGPTTGFMTVLGVIRDPSLPYLYAGCLIVIFGVLQCFCQTYRECWMLATPNTSGGTDVRLAMKLHGSGDTPLAEMTRIAETLRSMQRHPELGAPNVTEEPRAEQPPATKKRPAKSRKV